MLNEHYPEHGHQKYFHCPFDQATEAETDKIIVLGINHLHQGCEHGLSGCEDRPDH
ncbi:hypothetical protein D3C76_1772140 [compost metagenome]